MNKLIILPALVLSLLMMSCTGDSGGSGKAFASLNVIERIETSEIRYAGGTIDVDIHVFDNVSIAAVEMWLIDPGNVSTPLGNAVFNGDYYETSYTVPANTSLVGAAENYALRVRVIDTNGTEVRDINYDVSVPAMQVPPDPPAIP